MRILCSCVLALKVIIVVESCTTNEFECTRSNLCIAYRLRCNDDFDCMTINVTDDFSDELGCDSTTSCPEALYRCDSGQCVDADARCNSVTDCNDGSDEEGCVAEVISTRAYTIKGSTQSLLMSLTSSVFSSIGDIGTYLMHSEIVPYTTILESISILPHFLSDISNMSTSLSRDSFSQSFSFSSALSIESNDSSFSSSLTNDFSTRVLSIEFDSITLHSAEIADSIPSSTQFLFSSEKNSSTIIVDAVSLSYYPTSFSTTTDTSQSETYVLSLESLSTFLSTMHEFPSAALKSLSEIPVIYFTSLYSVEPEEKSILITKLDQSGDISPPSEATFTQHSKISTMFELSMDGILPQSSAVFMPFSTTSELSTDGKILSSSFNAVLTLSTTPEMSTYSIIISPSSNAFPTYFTTLEEATHGIIISLSSNAFLTLPMTPEVSTYDSITSTSSDAFLSLSTTYELSALDSKSFRSSDAFTSTEFQVHEVYTGDPTLFNNFSGNEQSTSFQVSAKSFETTVTASNYSMGGASISTYKFTTDSDILPTSVLSTSSSSLIDSHYSAFLMTSMVDLTSTWHSSFLMTSMIDLTSWIKSHEIKSFKTTTPSLISFKEVAPESHAGEDSSLKSSIQTTYLTATTATSLIVTSFSQAMNFSGTESVTITTEKSSTTVTPVQGQYPDETNERDTIVIPIAVSLIVILIIVGVIFTLQLRKYLRKQRHRHEVKHKDIELEHPDYITAGKIPRPHVVRASSYTQLHHENFWI